MQVDVKEAKILFYRLLERVADGEEITISNAGVPTARLVPIQYSLAKRELGIDEGKIWMADDFDGPRLNLQHYLPTQKNPCPRRGSVSAINNVDQTMCRAA